jgi:hypothetical protein
MASQFHTRRCACGTRLARDNRADACTACQKAASRRLSAPPAVAADFWDDPDLKSALGGWHIGRVIRAYRLHPFHHQSIPQAVVAAWFDLTQAQLSRIENGPAVTDLARLIPMARALDIPDEFLWFKLPNQQASIDAGQRPEDSLTSGYQDSPETALSQALSSRQLPGPEHGYAATMQSFRTADRQVGGGHLYATVVNYLQGEVAPRMFGIDHDGGDARVAFTAAAALTEMAGWMAHDAGRDRAAGQHFARSLDLVRLGQDRQLGVHILASMSHLAHHQGKPSQAVRYAQRGRRALVGGPRLPELEARLLAMQARGFAALRRSDDCTRLLVEAERVLGSQPGERRSPWVSHFDEGSLANEASRCLLQLGDLPGAQGQAARVIELRPGDRTRSRAFGQLLLATALVAQDRLDEACAVAREVLNATQQLGSRLVLEQLLDLKRLLTRHQDGRVVADFLSCLEDTVRQRVWLFQWQTEGGHGGQAGLGDHR